MEIARLGRRLVWVEALLVALPLGCSSLSGLAGVDGDDAPPSIAPTSADGGRACAPGFGDCDGDPTNGCETPLDTNASHCGFCGNACAPLANGYPVCDNGQCGLGCNDGYGDCDGTVANGCETPVSVDADNCGACGHDCRGASCSAGLCEPVTLAADRAELRSIAIDDADLYWASTTQVVKLPGKRPGYPVVLMNGSQLMQIAVDGTHVYAAGDGTRRCALPDCSGGIETIVPNGGLSDLGVALDAERVYVATLYSITESWIRSVPKRPEPGDGGAPPAAVHARGEDVALALAVDASRLYWSSPIARELRTMPKVAPDAASGEPLAEEPAGITAMAISKSEVFWASGDEIKRCRKDGSAAPVTVVKAASPPSAIAVDGSTLYWLERGTASTGFLDGAVMRCSAETCLRPVRLAAGQVGPVSIAVDGTHVYWATSPGGTIMKVAK